MGKSKKRAPRPKLAPTIELTIDECQDTIDALDAAEQLLELLRHETEAEGPLGYGALVQLVQDRGIVHARVRLALKSREFKANAT